MTTMNSGGLDNLSNLREELCKLERVHVAPFCSEIRQSREGVIAAVGVYAHSRYNLGRALRAYKVHFKAERAWIAAAEIVGDAIGRDQKTVFRIIADFERADRLPAITIEAMQDQNIDPGKHAYADAIEELIEMPSPETREEAATAVATTMKQHSERKRKQATSRTPKDRLEEFTDRIVKQFEQHYRAVPSDQRDRELQYVFDRIVTTLHSPIRELRQYSRPAMAPQPVNQEVA